MIPNQSIQIDLPINFRVEDFLTFYRRDTQEVAEKVTSNSLGSLIEKGIVWNGAAALLSFQFFAKESYKVVASLHTDGKLLPDDIKRFEVITQHMLGLDQATQMFEEQYKQHPQIGTLIKEQPGLRIPVTSTPFEALTWAIAGQQISVSAALSLRRKLIQATNIQPPSHTLLCHPTAKEVAGLSLDELKGAGFSNAKATALLMVSEQVATGQLPLDEWLPTEAQITPVDEVREKLQAIKGIGPWTINYTLLRGYGWLDGSLHGDVAVRRAIQNLQAQDEKVTANEAEKWLKSFAPYRALVAAHLWSSLHVVA